MNPLRLLALLLCSLAPLVPSQPEMREYRMRFWDKGEPNGEWTLWREIAVAP